MADCAPMSMCGVIEQVGPTLLLKLDQAAPLLPSATRANTKLDREKNLAPYKHARAKPLGAGAVEIVVDEGFVADRFPQRPSHITIVPFNEKPPAESIAQLVGQEVEVAVLPEIFWTRGSSGNAVCGTLGAFYANLVLSDATVAAIEQLRMNAGLAPRPPCPPQAEEASQDDPRLRTFRFHQSVGCIIPDFMHELDERVGTAPAGEVQELLVAGEARLRAWMQGFCIEPLGSGNVLVELSHKL